MRHRIKKIPTLSKLSHIHNHHLLHSDKSTYFYKGKVSSLGKHILYSPSIPLLGGIVLLLVLGLMISPSMAAGGSGVLGRVDKASAASEQDFGAGRTVSLSIINNGTTLADDTTVSADATPGVVSYIDNTIRINTSKIAKYYVGVQAAEDGTSDLIGAQYKETIAGVGDNVSPANFGDNTWGYSLTDNISTASSALTYSTLPAYNTNSPLQYTSSANPADGNHDLKLTFAAKINANKPSDHYQTKAMVSVAADAKTLFGGITTMQEMTNSVCNDAYVGENKVLTDSRDGSTYTVAKLNDNKCWMTQNLRIINKRLTSDSSDIVEDYTVPASTLWGGTTAANTNKAYYAGDETYGGYYSWYAATAGTGNSSVINGDASGSICPIGWRLPKGGEGGEFQTLYDLGSSWIVMNNVSGRWFGGAVTAAGAAFFPATGVVVDSSLSPSTGKYGHYWSATANDRNSAYMLHFGVDDINPVNSDYRAYGRSVRCVAR